MKTVTFTALLLLMLIAAPSWGQTFKEGNLVGIHTVTFDLNPDVTFNQFKKHFKEKVIPAMEQNFEMDVYLLKSVRGENANSFGLAFIYDSDDVRNKYWNEDGTPSDLWNSQMEKIRGIMDESSAMGTWSSSYNDWIVQ